MNKDKQNTDQEVDDFFKNYQDRGMLKWAGFYLSDHTLKIQKDDEKRSKVYEKREEMPYDDISNALIQAYTLQVAVSIQLRELDKELKYGADISGYVLGFSDDSVVIEDADLKTYNIALIDINNVVKVTQL